MKRFAVSLVALCMLSFFSSSAVFAFSAGTQTPATVTGIAGGSAFTGYLKAASGNNLIGSDPLFWISLGCTTSNKHISSTAASTQLEKFASTGTLANHMSVNKTGTNFAVQASSTAQSVNILSGLITSDAITASASSSVTATQATSSGNASFTHLIVAGAPISSHPAPNTTISLSGLGGVVLNEQYSLSNSSQQTDRSVTAIDVSITQTNQYSLPVGTHIFIIHADTDFARTSVEGTVSAVSHGLVAYSNASQNTIESGPWSTASIACGGGNVTNSAGPLNASSIGNTGTLSSTASGQLSSPGPQATSTATIQNLHLLAGLITADNVSASAHTTTNVATTTMSLTNGKVLGSPVSNHPGPNTRINIPGLGYLVFNEHSTSTSSTDSSAWVNAIDLHVTTSNLYKLPVGESIIVGQATASARTS